MPTEPRQLKPGLVMERVGYCVLRSPDFTEASQTPGFAGDCSSQMPQDKLHSFIGSSIDQHSQLSNYEDVELEHEIKDNIIYLAVPGKPN